MKRNFIPWFFLPLVAITGLFLYVLRARFWQARPVEAVAVLGLQWLLTLRILIGIAGPYIDHERYHSRAEALLDVAGAWLCIPILATALIMRGQAEDRRQVPALAAFLAIGVAAALWWLHALDNYKAPAMIVAGTFAALLCRYVVRDETSLLALAAGRWHAMRHKFEDWKVGVRLVAGAAIVRLSLALTGVVVLSQFSKSLKLTERIGPLQLANIYQPVMIVGFALLLAGFVQQPGWKRGFGLTALFGGAIFFVALAVKDFGTIPFYGWPIAIVLATVGFGAAARSRPVAAAWACLPLIAPFAVFALAFAYGYGGIPDDEKPADFMKRAVEWNDQNTQRLVRWANPAKVPEFGNRQAFEMLDQAASMEPLGRRLNGRGYMTNNYVRGRLTEYQYIDNVTAIHIMGPFGRIGMIALVLFYGALGLALTQGRTAPNATNLAGRMAALTLVWAGLYMALANLNQVPFTGRNVYFLGVTSGGDLIEGLAMLLLAALPWLRAADGDVGGRAA